MDELTGFSLYLLQKGNKRSTVKLHVATLVRLRKNIKSLSLVNVNLFLYQEKERGCTGTYLNQYITALRLYGQYLKVDTYQSLIYFKEEEYIKATMSDVEIDAFLRLPPVSVTRKHARTGTEMTYIYNKKGYDTWTLFFSIMAFTGMRPGEVAHLTINTVDFGQSIFILRDTKTNTPRYVPIPPNLQNALQLHIQYLKGDYLFPAERQKSNTKEQQVFDDTDWHYNFQQRIKRLQIKRDNLTCYSLRHSFITTMLDEDVNLFKVQKIVGHRQIATTAHYTHLTTKDLQRTITKHPMVRKASNPQSILQAIRDAVKKFELEVDTRFRFILSETENSLSLNVEIVE